MNNSVARHLLKLTGHNDPEFVSCTWDASHSIELAAKDARRLQSKSKELVGLIQNTYGPVSEIGKKHARGKKWRKLKKIAKKTSKKCYDDLQSYEDPSELYLAEPLVFRPFCETRFATYTYDALNSFRRNYHLHYRLLEKNRDKALPNIANAEFVLNLNALSDFYREVGRLSRFVQRPDLFTWNVENAVIESIGRFSQMKSEFEGARSPELTKNFAQASAELADRGTFRRRPVIGNKMQFKVKDEGKQAEMHFLYEDDIKKATKEIASHIEKFTQRLESRMSESRPQILNWTNNVFSAAKILSRGEDTSPRWLKRLYDRSSQTCLYSDNLSFEDFREEYYCFCKKVRELASADRDADQSSQPIDQELYMNLLENPSQVPNVMTLLSSCVARTYCESVTEGCLAVISSIF